MHIKISEESQSRTGMVTWKRLATDILPRDELKPGETVVSFDTSDVGINYSVTIDQVSAERVARVDVSIARALSRSTAANGLLKKENDELREKNNQLREQIDGLCDPTLKSMRLEDGRFNMELAGQCVERLALMMATWFRESGATNYVEMTVVAIDHPFESYQVYVQKQGDGAKTPHELRKEAEAERDSLIAELDAIHGMGTRWRHKKRGTVYAELFRAGVQAATKPIQEGDTVVVYYGGPASAQRACVREVSEFEDGRFEKVEEKDED